MVDGRRMFFNLLYCTNKVQTVHKQSTDSPRSKVSCLQSLLIVHILHWNELLYMIKQEALPVIMQLSEIITLKEVNRIQRMFYLIEKID